MIEFLLELLLQSAGGCFEHEQPRLRRTARMAERLGSKRREPALRVSRC
jgi:hypothetical protein